MRDRYETIIAIGEAIAVFGVCFAIGVLITVLALI